MLEELGMQLQICIWRAFGKHVIATRQYADKEKRTQPTRKQHFRPASN